jgi:Mrp family chromosome partitioning ATPase
MTEQSRIPLPGEGGKPGKSLFERAEDAFGLDGLKAAPMPRELAEPTKLRVKKAPQEAHSESPSRKREVGDSPRVSAVAFRGTVQPIDRRRLAERGLIVPEGGATALLEEFRIIKRQVLQAARSARAAGRGEAAQRVLVSSPLPGEGKTFCAVNLALAIAVEKDTEVVLVDADFAKPSIPSLLRLSGELGLMDSLADPRLPIEHGVIPTDVPGLFVLPAGGRTSSDSEYLASGRTGEVLDRLTAGVPNRIVIFDSPPALAASPASELARHVGQTLVVCRADHTGQSALEDALSLLSVCADLKLLLNDAHFSPSGRRFGGYGYGGHAE